MIPRVGVTNFSVNAYIGPIVATLLGVWILGEVVHPLQLVGIIIVMTGLLVIDGRLLRRFARPATQPTQTV
jgi:drug/metabolite transporter (DMT)-like permease